MTTLVELIPALLEKSIEGKIDWEQLSSTSFIASIGELVVEVSKVSDTVVRLRRDSLVIESVAYTTTRAPTDGMIVQLYEIARRKGLRVDETLNSLKNALDSL
jgi:hypothetical protein